jgi:hypothetical protein
MCLWSSLLISVLSVDVAQWAFGTFSCVLFFIQIGSFVLYPETARVEQVCSFIVAANVVGLLLMSLWVLFELRRL